jgi:hypothetical protein
MLYAGRVNLFAKVSELFMYTVFQLVICEKALLECILQEAGKVEVGGAVVVLKWDCMEDENLIHLPVWQNPSDLLF